MAKAGHAPGHWEPWTHSQSRSGLQSQRPPSLGAPRVAGLGTPRVAGLGTCPPVPRQNVRRLEAETARRGGIPGRPLGAWRGARGVRGLQVRRGWAGGSVLRPASPVRPVNAPAVLPQNEASTSLARTLGPGWPRPTASPELLLRPPSPAPSAWDRRPAWRTCTAAASQAGLSEDWASPCPAGPLTTCPTKAGDFFLHEG